MNQIINLNMVIEKELELERQGNRRTRRWIGDASKVADSRWYQARVNRVSNDRYNLDEIGKVEEIKPQQDARPSIITRFLNLPYTRRQPANSDI